MASDCCQDLVNSSCAAANGSACAGAVLEERSFDMPWWASLFWTVAFVVMLVIAIGGNSLVCMIILGHQHMRTVTNYFLVNLSVANLLMSCLNCSFNFVYMVNADWPFGVTYCVINNFFANFTVAASVLTLMAVAMERYLVIVHPLSRRIRKWEAITCIVIIWLSSAGLSTPCLLYSTIVSHRYPSGRVVHGCILVWPDGPQMASFADYVYNMIFLALTYILPMIAMAVSYTIIGRQLWGAKSIGVLTDRQMASIKSKRKIVRMFIIVVSMFALSWLPYQVYFVYTYHDISLAQRDYVQHLFLAFYWLAMSYSMVNPLIYFWMNRKFRLYLVRWCRCACFSGGLDYVKTVVSRVDSVVVVKGRQSSAVCRVTTTMVRGSSMTGGGGSSSGSSTLTPWSRDRPAAAVLHGRAATALLNGLLSPRAGHRRGSPLALRQVCHPAGYVADGDACGACDPGEGGHCRNPDDDEDHSIGPGYTAGACPGIVEDHSTHQGDTKALGPGDARDSAEAGRPKGSAENCKAQNHVRANPELRRTDRARSAGSFTEVDSCAVSRGHIVSRADWGAAELVEENADGANYSTSMPAELDQTVVTTQLEVADTTTPRRQVTSLQLERPMTSPLRRTVMTSQLERTVTSHRFRAAGQDRSEEKEKQSLAVTSAPTAAALPETRRQEVKTTSGFERRSPVTRRYLTADRSAAPLPTGAPSAGPCRPRSPAAPAPAPAPAPAQGGGFQQRPWLPVVCDLRHSPQSGVQLDALRRSVLYQPAADATDDGRTDDDRFRAQPARGATVGRRKTAVVVLRGAELEVAPASGGDAAFQFSREFLT